MAKPKKTTLDLIYERPTCKKLRWNDLVVFIRQNGGEVKARGGSKRVLKLKTGGPYFTDEPHPSSYVVPGAVEGIRKWLNTNGIKPSKGDQ